MANAESLGPKGIVARFLLAILLVFATFNPWGKSFYHWTVQPVFATGGGIGTLGPVKVLAALLLLVAAILATLVWLLLSQHLLSAESSKPMASRRLSGQVDTDQVA